MQTRALTIHVTRGSVVESRHEVQLAAVRDGQVVVARGDMACLQYVRSCAKPFQATLLVQALPDIEPQELAVAASSHVGTGEQLARVATLSARTQTGRPLVTAAHECSGKHAGMLAVCAARGWSSAGYWSPTHPLQLAYGELVAGAASVDPGSIVTTTDGCGVPTWAMTLAEIARAYGRLGSLDGGGRVASAMTTHPEIVGGPDSLDTRIMASMPGWLAKRGAEGIICLVGPGGLAIAAKCADGSSRPLEVALAWILRELGETSPLACEAPLRDVRGRIVGTIGPDLRDEAA